MGNYSAYSGRLGKIIDNVWIRYNAEPSFGKSQPLLTTPLIVRFCNKCTADIAQADFWTKSTLIDVVASQANYDLLTLVPDIGRVISCYWTGYTTPMGVISNYTDYRALVNDGSSSTSEPQYFPMGNIIYVYPTPTANGTGSLEVYHSYLPADLGGINYLTAGAAVSIAGGKVDIPCVNDFSVGDTVTIYGTTNYNGAKTLLTGTNPTTLRITATYVAETFATTDYCIKTLNETPLVPQVSDDAYETFCLQEIASKDYAGKDYSEKLWIKFVNEYRRSRGRLIHQTTSEGASMGFPR